MGYKQFVGLFLGLMVLVGCQPEVLSVEVTRVVDNIEVVEVTRIVSEPVLVEATAVALETQPAQEQIIVEVTKTPLGSDSRPVQLLFSPVVDTAVITSRGEPFIDALQDATGKQFVVGILDDEQAVIDLLCDAPQDSIGFLSPPGYVLAEAQCAVQAGNVAIHDDAYPWQTGMIVTRRDSGINELQDLEGKTWAVASLDSLANFLYFQALLEENSIETAEIIPVNGESAAMLAVLNEEADFASATFVPPIMPYEERLWDYDEDNPEPGRFLGLPATRSPIGYVLVNGEPEFGGYRLRDARSRIFDVEPTIYERTKIVMLSPQIPNETISFGADFPLGLARQVMETMTTFTATETCKSSLCAADFYGWAGMQEAEDAAYEPLRFVRDTLDLSSAEMLAAQ